MRAKSFEAIMRDKARQRMADLRKLKGNRRAALAYQRRFGFADSSKGKITNMREVLEAMADWAPGASRRPHKVNSRKSDVQPLWTNRVHALRPGRLCYSTGVKAKSFAAIKREEARQRMADLRTARKSRRAALLMQRRCSLTGDASKWQITNLAQVLKAMG